jgi:tetratricopeptide (TPR) repeat protein
VFGACQRFLLSIQSGFVSSHPLYKHEMELMYIHESNVRVLVTKRIHELEQGDWSLDQKWIDAIHIFVEYLLWGTPQPMLVNQAVNIVSRTKPGSSDEARMRYNLAREHHRISSYEIALEQFERAKTLYQHFEDVNSVFNCEIYILDCLHRLGSDGAVLLDLLEDVQSRYEHQNADPRMIAVVLHRRAQLGFYYNILPPPQVRKLSENARELFWEVNCAVKAYGCLSLIARSYLKDQFYNEAIKVIVKMEQFSQNIKIPHLYSHYLRRINYLKGMGQWGSLLVCQILLFIQASRAVGDAINLATGLEELGEIHVRNRDRLPARAAYQEILQLCKKGSEYMFKYISERCSNNLGYVENIIEGQTPCRDELHFSPPPRF